MRILLFAFVLTLPWFGLGAAAAVRPPEPAGEEGEKEASYAYDSAGKRDPFRPLFLDTRVAARPKVEPLTPLQRYELGQLRLVGIIHQLEPPRAMVEDSPGLGFILTPGTPVGPNGGVVAEIRPREVVVEEWHTDVIGQEHRTQHVLALSSDDETGP